VNAQKSETSTVLLIQERLATQLREFVAQWPELLWDSAEVNALEEKATWEAKPIPADDRANAISGMLPFLSYLCDVPHVQKIGVRAGTEEKLIHLLVDPIHLDILTSVVDATCDWWDAHPEEPYWEVLTVGNHRFSDAASTYDLIVTPRR
jgi:hypothetical protein